KISHAGSHEHALYRPQPASRARCSPLQRSAGYRVRAGEGQKEAGAVPCDVAAGQDVTLGTGHRPGQAADHRVDRPSDPPRRQAVAEEGEIRVQTSCYDGNWSRARRFGVPCARAARSPAQVTFVEARDGPASDSEPTSRLPTRRAPQSTP